MATTAKQLKANVANSLKSTGPKSSSGKAIVAKNALKHGLFSGRIVLDGESEEDFRTLLDGLIQSLGPVGTLELVLVEKIGVAIWKQLRLASAEKASIELHRRNKNRILDLVESSLGTIFDTPISEDELLPKFDCDAGVLSRIKLFLSEYDSLDPDILKTGNIEAFESSAPLLYRQLKDEANREGFEGVESFLGISGGALESWANGLASWCKRELAKHERRANIQAVATLVRAQLSAPIGNELLIRYQVAVDNELYRAISELRKQQAFRRKLALVIEGELVAA